MGKVLILKLDAIGDYFLSRKSIEFLKKDSYFSVHDFILLGNVVWKDAAEAFDKEIYSQMYFVNINDLEKEENIQELGALLSTFACDILFCPVRSRTLATDVLVKHINIPIKIAPLGNNVNNPYKEQTDSYYTFLVPESNPYDFEVACHMDIAQKLGASNNFDFSIKREIEPSEGENTVVLFLGASNSYKQWPATHWAILHDNLYEKGYHCILAGGADCVNTGKEVSALAKYSSLDKTGQTTIPELVEIIQKAKFLVSNDSMAIHIAAMYKVPHLCIGAGHYYQRFVPYPKSICPNSLIIYPQAFLENTELTAEVAYYSPNMYSLNSIMPHAVLEMLENACLI